MSPCDLIDGMNVAANEKNLLKSLPQGLLIGEEWRPADSGKTFEVEDPSTGSTIAEVADASLADTLGALEVAHSASDSWSVSSPRERSEILRKAFEIIMSRVDDLALLMTLEMGKPLAESRAEVAYGAEFFRWFSEEAVRIDGRFTEAPDGKSRIIVMHQPVGMCLLITPWNFPLAMGTRKIGPAIAAGCTMILKPAELTPLSSIALAQIMVEAGLPSGVLNVVTTSKPSTTIQPILYDPRLRKLSFTGSTTVGSLLASEASANMVRTSMELGGNAPFMVFEDADIEAAVDGAVIAKLRNGGEACTSANRFIIHESVEDEFTRKLVERFDKLIVGRGTDPGVNIGPLISAQAREKVSLLVETSTYGGAKVLMGGSELPGPGYFYPPTVISGVSPDAPVLAEEIFGPVAPIITFSSEQEALRLANSTDYGLVSYLYTRDLSRAIRFSEGLQFGMVGLNQGIVSNAAAPFGGVKQSGIGREGSHEGLYEYLDTKYVAMAV